MEITGTDNKFLSLRNVGKTFADTKGKSAIEVLRDISFDLNKGEFISLVGASGCGKSTLLRIISGLENLSTGSITYGGSVMNTLKMGFVFQNYNSFPWLTVRQNIESGLYQVTDLREKADKVHNWLQYTGLTDFAGFYPKNLSGGMRQRLAIARTMVTEPNLLLMDEPFGALDIKTRESMQKILLDAVKMINCTVMFVTHDLSEAIFLSDKIVLMEARPGRVLKIFATPAEKTKDIRQMFRTVERLELYNEILSLI